MSPDDHLTVQQVYRDWALLGLVILGALLFTLVLRVMLWNRSKKLFLASHGFPMPSRRSCAFLDLYLSRQQ